MLRVSSEKKKKKGAMNMKTTTTILMIMALVLTIGLVVGLGVANAEPMRFGLGTEDRVSGEVHNGVTSFEPALAATREMGIGDFAENGITIYALGPAVSDYSSNPVEPSEGYAAGGPAEEGLALHNGITIFDTGPVGWGM